VRWLFPLLAGVVHLVPFAGSAENRPHAHDPQDRRHFAAHFAGQTHDVRTTLWTVGSLILIFMTVKTLLTALSV
jgi:hypothetical protein